MLRKAKRIVRKRVIAFRKRKVLTDSGDAPPAWYDKAYADVSSYQSHWSESGYLPVWEAICARVPPGARVFEIGCGSAQLARMLLDKGIPDSYVGFDFSATAVAMARRNVPGHRVEVADAHTSDLFSSVDYDVVICTEVLEHITEDLAVLSRIPPGRRVLATVPDFDWDSHVRFFDDVSEVKGRYGTLFEKLDVTEHHHAGDPSGHNGTFFLMNGVLK